MAVSMSSGHDTAALGTLPAPIERWADGRQEATQRIQLLALRRRLSTEAVPVGGTLPRAFLKRSLDFTVAALLLTAALPVIALVAIIIKLDSRGPVFYRASRIGHRGLPLRMLKFRKMHHHATGPALTMADDHRFTRVGEWLARTKLDELPQLWNVVKGDMSLIGPRPEDPSFVAMHLEEFAELLRVRPGVTGLSQLAFAEESRIRPGER